MDVPQEWPFQLIEPANEDEQRLSPQDETACEQPDEHPPAMALLYPLLIPQAHAPPRACPELCVKQEVLKFAC